LNIISLVWYQTHQGVEQEWNCFTASCFITSVNNT